MLMGALPDRLLEGASEVRRRQAGLAREDVDRQVRRRARGHQLEHAAPNGWREPAARPSRYRHRGTGLLQKLDTLSAEASVSTNATPLGVPSLRLLGERADEMPHLGTTDAKCPAERDRRRVVVARAHQSIEAQRVDRDAHVGIWHRARYAERERLTGRVDRTRARRKRHRPIAVLLFDLDGDRRPVGIEADVMVREGDVIDLGDVVASGLEQDARPVERLGACNAAIVAKGDDAARCESIE